MTNLEQTRKARRKETAEDFSTKDNKIEGEENMPKFDVVVGNPPFKGSLYVDFLNISYMISKKYTLFVHPGTIYFNEKANNKQQKEILYKTNILNKIKNIDIIRHTKYFNIALWSPMTITLIDKEYNNSGILINDKIKNTSYYTSINQLNKWGNLNEYYSIKNKILSSLDNLLNHKNSIGKFYVNISLLRGHSYTNDDKLFDDDFYTLIPRTEFIANSPNKGLYFGFNTENEANNFLNYLKCNFTRFSLSLFKFNMNLNRGELKGIPWLDFTQEWSDEKLYKYFNLTQEEINFIETNIPKYYND